MIHRLRNVPILFLATVLAVQAQKLPAFEATPEWLARIEAIAPDKPLAIPRAERTALVFSLMTGFKHWCTPHTANVVKILGEKSGAFQVVVSDDIRHFEPENIKQFDLIVLNNTCSLRPTRHLFFDVLQDMEAAQALEQSLMDHIAAGNGLAALHGGITIFNNSDAFSALLGGSFDRHPRQQTVTGRPVHPHHPVTSAFQGTPLVHVDEPYYFNRAYTNFNFHPLLALEHASMNTEVRRYIAWIKPHGKGRVFVCSPSHNAQSFEQPALLQFILNGLQYAAGDLACDDTPIPE